MIVKSPVAFTLLIMPAHPAVFCQLLTFNSGLLWNLLFGLASSLALANEVLK